MASVPTRNKSGRKSRTMLRTRLTASCVKLVAHLTPYVEPEMLGLTEIIKSRDVCIDIGAAAGLYTVELSKLVGPKGQVLSVEPLVFAHPALSRLLGTKNHLNVTNYCFALGSQSGTSLISVPMGKFGPITGRSFLAGEASGLGSNSEFSHHKEVEVHVDTLDEFCNRENIKKLDFIKIDVEGAEKKVFEGGAKTIAKFKPAILVEIEARHLTRFKSKPKDVVDWLKKLNYKMYIWNRRWEEALEISPEIRNYLFRVD